MNLLSRQKVFASACALAALPGLVLFGSGSASADPVNPSTPRTLAGMGSDTTQDVLNRLAEVITIDGQKVIASYDSQGPAAQTKTAAACNYQGNVNPTLANNPGVRGNGSGAGRSRLVEALTPGDAKFGCLDFARSSAETLTAVPANTGGLTYIPFALDGVTYAQRADSTNSKTLTAAQLRLIYTCDPQTTTNFRPILPNTASGTRQFFLAQIGVTEAQVGSCVENGTRSGTVLQENDGTILTDPRQLVPYSVAQYSSQQTGVADVRGTAILGSIGGQPSQTISANAAFTRRVFNVVPTSRISEATLNRVFVGPTSLVCSNGATISSAGFANIADCGSTSRVTG